MFVRTELNFVSILPLFLSFYKGNCSVTSFIAKRLLYNSSSVIQCVYKNILKSFKICLIITFSEEQIHNMKAKAKELEKQAEKAITDLEAKLKEEAERKRI